MVRKVIYGPPGTGKTTKIINMIKSYIEDGVDPMSIGVCTYTKSAAKTVFNRAIKETTPSDYIGTIHSMAYSAIELLPEQVIDKEKLKDFKFLYGYNIHPKELKDDSVFANEDMFYYSMYNLARSHCLNKYDDIYLLGINNRFRNNGSQSGFARFCEVYDAWKEMNFYYDFNDMLLKAVGAPMPLDVLFVDEAQDLSVLQWALLESWMPNIGTVIICGDDDQAIYKFNGGYDKGMVNFQNKHNAEITVLSQSFRVPRKVFDISVCMHKYMGIRTIKNYAPRYEEGSCSLYAEFNQIPIEVYTKDTLILFRNHIFSRDIEKFLKLKKIPYFSEKVARAEKNKITAIKQWGQFQKDVRKYRVDSKKVIKKTILERYLNTIPQHYYIEGEYNKIVDLPWWDVLNFEDYEIDAFHRMFEDNTFGDMPKVRLASMHSSKGDEAENVIIYDAMGEFTRENFMDDLETEAKIFYVAVTRAKSNLHIVTGRNGVLIDYFLNGGLYVS